MNGLSASEAAARLASAGPNALPEPPPQPVWRRFLRQFASPLVYILLFALAFDLGLWIVEGAHGWPIEVGAIALILLLCSKQRSAIRKEQTMKTSSSCSKLWNQQGKNFLGV